MEERQVPQSPSDPLRSEAFALIERNIAANVEEARKREFSILAVYGQNTFGGLTGRVGLEVGIGYSLSSARIKSYINQAFEQAIDHYNFVVRREENDRPRMAYSPLRDDGDRFDPLIPNVVGAETLRLLALSLILGDNGGDGINSKTQAFEIIERNVIATVENERKAEFQTLAGEANQNTFAGVVGRIGLEAFTAYKLTPKRVGSYVNQAYQMAVDHHNFVVRREDNELESLTWEPREFNSVASLHPLLPVEVIRTLALALIHLDHGSEGGTALKDQAFGLIERNIVALVEKTRRDVTGEIGRLHNEVANGLRVPTSRMTTLLNQAVADAVAHQKALERTDDDDIPSPPISYEIKRLLVESYLVALAGNLELAAAVKETALKLIERDVVANEETIRKNNRYALTLTDPDSFGYHWGRVGLAFEEALIFSDNAIKRAVTSAEESLMNMGKWVGTVAEYTMTISQSGEYSLPREIETVLFVAFDGDPAPVHDRYMEYMRGGTGIKTTDNAWRKGFSDLGHIPDPEDGGKIKRKYFITVPTEDKPTVICYLAKRRFAPHTQNDDPMFLRNYEAVAQAALAILTQGQVGSIDASRKLLSEQITQQFMKTQTWGVHNRPVASLR